MSYTKLNNLLTKHGISASDLAYENFDDIENADEVIGKRKLVHKEGDCEGGGDHSEKVFYFEKFDCYVMVTGYYSSYNGTDWDEWQKVKPKEKTITVYE
jgi:hypothetical protein